MLLSIPNLERVYEFVFDSNGVQFLPDSSRFVCAGAAGNPGEVLLYDSLARREVARVTIHAHSKKSL